jgi:hypothetical protein
MNLLWPSGTAARFDARGRISPECSSEWLGDDALAASRYLFDGNNQFAETAQHVVYVANPFLDVQSLYLRRQSVENGYHFELG